MQYADKYSLTREQNIRFAKKNFTRLVHTNSRFEGVSTTLPQTQTIMDGMGVSGVSVKDMNTIVNLKRGWEMVVQPQKEALTLNYMKKINAVVAAQDSLAPGELRTGGGLVQIGSDEDFVPDPVNERKEQKFLTELLANSAISITDKAMTLMYHSMRNQIFWDGNKRTATLVANKLMIDNGVGLINIPLNHWEKWNELIADYYRSNDMGAIKKWTYEVGVQGVQLP
ncbi:Fic family protein [Pediococcus damnosus]|uniref:Fic family protein n=1 Tax=Pediococcus damnosus TaxID=51663 RepID=UPI000C1C940B|nr:Fic family protein [Pediococcus damnosus]PIO85851.1 filamentation induced by cAMP protein fic [Pediococcus damnosus]